METNPYAAPKAQVEEVPPPEANGGPTGLGGWLILVGIGTVLAPIVILAGIAQTYPPLFQDGVWAALTTPGSEQYRAGWGALVIFEIVVNVAMVVASMVAIGLYFSKSPRFPVLFIGLLAAGLAFLVIDLIAVRVVVPEAPVDSGSIGAIVRSTISCAIWIPYMRMSVRVKNTFVH
jgi:hypothetical protein